MFDSYNPLIFIRKNSIKQFQVKYKQLLEEDIKDMECKYCGTSYRLTKWHNDTHACPDCDGVTDDLSIDDAEFRVDAWHLRHPTGKTNTNIFDENDSNE